MNMIVVQFGVNGRLNQAGRIYLECTIFYSDIPAKCLVGKNKKICLGINYIFN